MYVVMSEVNKFEQIACFSLLKNLRQGGNKYKRTFQTLYLSGQSILKFNKQNQAIYTIQQPIKIHLRSP